jgi:hypothetical protein
VAWDGCDERWGSECGSATLATAADMTCVAGGPGAPRGLDVGFVAGETGEAGGC